MTPTEAAATTFRQYRRSQIAELREYVPGEDMRGVSVAGVDHAAGSPKTGDMIARNPKNHEDQWLVDAQYFADNFEPLPTEAAEPRKCPIGLESSHLICSAGTCDVCQAARRAEAAEPVKAETTDALKAKLAETEKCLAQTQNIARGWADAPALRADLARMKEALGIAREALGPLAERSKGYGVRPDERLIVTAQLLFNAASALTVIANALQETQP